MFEPIYLLWIALALVFGLLAIAVLRALLMKSSVVPRPACQVDKTTQEKYATTLGAMIRVATIASREHPDASSFAELQSVMEQAFPNLAKTLHKTLFEGGSMIWRWNGSNPNLAPLVLMAHQDVVPASADGWIHPPFSGVVDGDEIYGRGTMDTKNTLFGIFQAVEELIVSGFVPEADVYLASSADEEVSGGGAERTVAWLKQQGVRPALVLDEGGAIVSGVLPTASKALALLGVIEKGYVTVKFTARSNGGHASMPPKHTPIARLATFIAGVEQHFPLKTKMIPEVAALFQTAAPSMKFPYRLLFGNLWLFRGLVTYLLPRINPYGRAMLSTTIAFTMQKGSDADNVIPAEAYVICNMRTHPIQNVAQSVGVLRAIAAKHDIETEILYAHESSPTVNTKAASYRYLVETVARHYPDVLISPYVILGATDARHYTQVSDCVIRFSPMRATNTELKKIHGLNESIRLDTLAESVLFFQDLIRGFHSAPHQEVTR